jgi:NAD(P)-dependent dehydrogenase (short-subunit alcohol dehydrogenase family)
VARYDLRDRVALITGGARGIGFATGEALARRGASIALVDLDGGEVADAAGRLGRDRAIGLVADVTDAAAIERAVAAAVDRFGGVDIVVANAGIAPTPGPVRVVPAEEWERVVEVNLLGVYRTARAGLEQVIARRGQIVLVSSVYAFVNGSMATPYAVAKAGVEQLGRALALELSVHGASATVAYFGWVDTRMVQNAFEERRRMTGHDEDLLPAFLLKRITPAEAGEALARGIERRAPRVLAPRWWAAVSALRGVLGPLLDAAGTRSERVQQALREAEEGAAARAGSAAGAAPDGGASQDFGSS